MERKLKEFCDSSSYSNKHSWETLPSRIIMEYVFVLLLLVTRALSDSCVTYTFEDGYKHLLTSNAGVCAGYPSWDVGHFEDTDLTGYEEQGANLIYPQEELSCVTSFMFPMAPGSVIEVNTFMKNAVKSDQIQVKVMDHVQGGHDVFVGQATNSPASDNYEAGWHTLVVPVYGYNANMTGYISIWGNAASTSTVLVDSFRYIPPGTEKSECGVYPLEPKPSDQSTSVSASNSEETTETTTKISTEPTVLSTVSHSGTTATWTSQSSVTTTESANPIRSTISSVTARILNAFDNPFWTPLRLKVAAGITAFILLILLLSLCCSCGSDSQVQVIVVK